MTIDFEAEGLLEGLDGPAREARRELLERLSEDGVSVDELRQASDEERLALLPVERVLGGGAERYTLDDLVERSGLRRDFLFRLMRALGMAVPDPAERAFNEADLEAAKRAKGFLEAGLPEEGIIEISRSITRSMASVAATIGRVFADTYLRAGDDEQSLALRYAEASRELVPRLGPVLEHILGVQLRAISRQAAVDASERAAGRLQGAVQLTVAFADLVGFTTLGEKIETEELGTIAERLEELAAEVAEGPVTLVKTIGDAVMLVSRDNDALLDATLNLVDAAAAEGEHFPVLRAGVARGEAVGRAGDWFGRPVNLASRITGIARPTSVLADEETKAAAGEGYRWSSAGARRVKGVKGQVRLYRVRRAEAEAED